MIINGVYKLEHLNRKIKCNQDGYYIIDLSELQGHLRQKLAKTFCHYQ